MVSDLYLGKKVDLNTLTETGENFYLDPDDLMTHGVIIGMTGSGKTGAAIVLIEEMILKKIPVIVIDPKGDAVNIALRFPNLSPEEFKKWIDPLKAQRENVSVNEYARRLSEKWKENILRYTGSLDVLKRLAENSEVLIFTPGYLGGLPISVLHDLNIPEDISWSGNEDILLERIKNTVSAILELIGRNPDPLKSNEHILLSQIIEYCWKENIKLDFSKLLALILEPPFSKIGAIDIDMFIPLKGRKQLAIDLNRIVASPSFRAWLTGVPLEFEKLLWSSDGKPRILVFYLSHLYEVQRMFTVTLILQNVYTWMFKQSGSSKLRTLLYFDEVYGYIPPYPKNPPSKHLLMLLMKQARAFGLGIVISTQNPVDIDYKALSNAGIWMIGRLQTENDKARVLEGLKIATNTLGGVVDEKEISAIISSLRKRMFLIHNIHQNSNMVFRTRWAYSYLRGPLTLQEVKKLVKKVNPPLFQKISSPVRDDTSTGLLSLPPKVSDKVRQFYLPAKYASQTGEVKAYYPLLMINASVSVARERPPVRINDNLLFLLDAKESFSDEDYQKGNRCGLTPRELNMRELTTSWRKDFKFFDVPDSYSRATFFKTLSRDIRDYIYRTYPLKIYKHKILGIYSNVGESKEVFLMRIRQKIEASLSEEENKLIEKYRKKFENIRHRISSYREKIRILKTDIEGLERQLNLYSAGTIFSLISRRTAYSKIATAARIRDRINIKREKIRLLEREIERLRSQEFILTEELKNKLEKIRKHYYDVNETVKEMRLHIKKSEIEIREISIVWVPLSLDSASLKPRRNLYTGKYLDSNS